MTDADAIVRRLSVWLLVLALAGPVAAAEPTSQPVDPLRASPADMQWWREARFGLFIHWGPVSIQGTELSWSRGKGKQAEQYDQLYTKFNPTEFDAKQWVAIAKSAGMKYVVFTTKHHDGFCMFDSKLTDHKIISPQCPFGRDVTAELAKACHDGGLRLGFYYSPPDWHHPDFHTKDHVRYIEYLHGQLRELCSNYGKVDVIWFDGLGGSEQDWDSRTMFKMIRSLQPHVIINNRGGLTGDFDTPEQTIGKFQAYRPWESCITLGTQWAWRPKDNLKSLQECIATLVRCSGGDGNLLLNVGPMPNGRIEPRQADRLKEIGDWLTRFGQTIYGTRGGPFLPGQWGASTCQADKIYLHVLNWPGESLALPQLPSDVLASRVLTGGKAAIRQTSASLEVSVPLADRDKIDTIIELSIAGSAEAIGALGGVSRSLTFCRPATASNVYHGDPNWGPDKAVDDDPKTRWATDDDVHAAWLEVDLGREQTIGRAFISEAYPGRVEQFELQRKDAGQWKPFATGKTIGPNLTMRFEPVTARYIRLNILRASIGPTIWEFQVFPPDGPSATTRSD